MEVGQPVFGRFGRCLGPFDQQPLTRRALDVFALAIRERPRPGGRAKRERCGPRLAWRQVMFFQAEAGNCWATVFRFCGRGKASKRWIAARPTRWFGSSATGGWDPAVQTTRARFDFDGIGQVPLAQVLAEIKLVPIAGISNHWQNRDLPLAGLIDQLQRQLRLALIADPFRQFDLSRPLAILDPFLRQVQPPTQRAAGFGTAPVQTDRHLAIGHFPQRAAVLAGHSHRVDPRLWETRFRRRIHTSGSLSRSTTFSASRRWTSSTAHGL